MKLVAIICVCLASCDAIRISPAPTRAEGVLANGALEWPSDPTALLNCPDEPHWGIWIDGRDAHKGETAYGEDYNAGVEPLFKTVYDLAKQGKEPDIELYHQLATMLGEHFDNNKGFHKVTKAVKLCLETQSKSRFNEVMEDVIVMDKHFMYKENKAHQLGGMFDEYNRRQNNATSQDERVMAIAFLVHNMAFAHPLGDHNGRSRVLMIQHELRRLNLGCGTFLYNNNRANEFNTVSEIAGKIKEGILMYNKWQETGVNPWTDPAVQQNHKTDFATDKKLTKCWDKHVNSKGHPHMGTSVE